MKVLLPDNDDFGFTKVKITSRRTGLLYDLWCDCLGDMHEETSPFIMIHSDIKPKSDEWLYISIDKIPQILRGNTENFPDYQMVLEYIRKNKEIFIRHWKGELDDLDMMLELEKEN